MVGAKVIENNVVPTEITSELTYIFLQVKPVRWPAFWLTRQGNWCQGDKEAHRRLWSLRGRGAGERVGSTRGLVRPQTTLSLRSKALLSQLTSHRLLWISVVQCPCCWVIGTPSAEDRFLAPPNAVFATLAWPRIHNQWSTSQNINCFRGACKFIQHCWMC